jgi:hypothetical protein
MSAAGRFSTISPVRRRLGTVWPLVPTPNIARHPSQKTDEIGARLAVPSGFIVLSRTTGVPK